MVLIIPFVVYSEYWKDIRQPARLPAWQPTLNKQHQLLLFWTKFWHKHRNTGGEKTVAMQHKSKEFIYLFLWLQIIFWMCDFIKSIPDQAIKTIKRLWRDSVYAVKSCSSG